ncbi:MAG: DUF885 domain-containing protein, partial [Sphingomonadales bacterium]|nr:DUF885 domain-containing protein [Sphingomonadales bacterium]
AQARRVAAPRHRPAAQGTGEEARLLRLFAEDETREAALHPIEGIAQGEAVDPAALAQVFTPELGRRQRASVDASLAALARIDAARLPPARQISYAAFDAEKRAERAMLAPDVLALTEPRPFNHFLGLHVQFPALMSGNGIVPFASTADYRRALRIDAAFAGVLDNTILRFRDGLATGVVESKLTVRNMIVQIDGLLAQGTTGSPFYGPVKAFPAAVPAHLRPALQREYADVIDTRVNPAYRRLRDFLRDEYLPGARDGVGLAAMKGGATLYPLLVAQETTLPLDPAQVHRLGLSEVARIQAEMDVVKAELGYAGPLRGFFDRIRADPRYHPKSADELAEGYARIGQAVDAQIPRLFSRVPRTPLEIRPFPAYRQRFEAGGSYDAGTADGTKPGTFYFNTWDLSNRFLTGMATLYLHEGKPGHHFQISLALEDASLPDFQRYGGNNAYVEGWALYAETLGYDMGLYRDPMQHWGTLDDEMLRAMRLVVDTGIHAAGPVGGWSREQAIAYMLANSGMGRNDAAVEVDRYIANPAQALSYKIGALTIERLRDKARAALGPRFDIRAFHEQVLGSGALPLPVLEMKIDRWIAAAR